MATQLLDLQTTIYSVETHFYDLSVEVEADTYINRTVLFDLQVEVYPEAVGTPLPTIPSIPTPDVPPIEEMMKPSHRRSVGTFQSRLGKFHDRLRRKMIDNTIYLTASATDAIRVSLKKTKQGDIVTRIIEEVSVVPIIFPPLEGVPFRRLMKKDGSYSVETLPAAVDLFPFTLETTQYHKINIDDLIIRILKDDLIQQPIVQILQITEQRGDFGQMSMIKASFDAVYFNETLPLEVIEAVVSIAERRLHLRW